MLLSFECSTQAGDILRGGAGGKSGQRNASTGSSAGAETANVAKANAKDRLARTTQAIAAVRNMQNGAKSSAIVPDGLVPGGLQRATGVNTKWDGAQNPVQSGNSVTIKQTESQAMLHWETFNVGRNTKLRFDQSAGKDDASKWIAFNKIFDPSGKPSQILGSISADGQVYVLNQNGIIFGAGSQVNVRALVASSLPINDNLVERGLLNNPDAQFLFSGLPISAGAKGTSAFTPVAPLTANGRIGDVVVEKGAFITSPVSSEGYGGRVMLVGPNVQNKGVIATPAGQTILAAGLQVGIDSHSSDDPSLRGLDVYVGAISDTALGSYDAHAENSGLIESARGNVTMIGRTVRQLGAIESSTSVDVNGRIDLLASYNAISNNAYDSAQSSFGAPFFSRTTGLVEFGPDSVTRILPEWSSAKTIARSTLPLRSQVNVRGGNIHLGRGAAIFAPNAKVNLDAGEWIYQPSTTNPRSTFVYSGGQIYLDEGSLIDVSGSTDVFIPLAHSVVTVQMRGSELANSPLQRTGILRGTNLVIDLRRTGTFYGQDWVGTPLGDASGYLNLIERNVGQLTMEGGDVNLRAGGSVVIRKSAVVDASGGYARNEGGIVNTSRVRIGQYIIDIADATPDRLYDGFYDGTGLSASAKWGVNKKYSHPLAPLGSYFQNEYISGANAGSISISASSMAIDGQLSGRAVIGPRQARQSVVSSSLPKLGRLELIFEAQDKSIFNPLFPTISPKPPRVVFIDGAQQDSPGSFAIDALGVASALPESRSQEVFLSTSLLGKNGFGELLVRNSDGAIDVPSGTVLSAPPAGGIYLSGANVNIAGDIIAPGGVIEITAYTFSPYLAKLLDVTKGDTLPLPNSLRGTVTLAAGSIISAAGLVVDDRPTAVGEFSEAVVIKGGSVSLEAFNIDLESGSRIDVSGGIVHGVNGEISYGDAGSINLLSGQDPELSGIIGGRLALNAEMTGFSGAGGGALSIKALLIQVGGTTSRRDVFAVDASFFDQGGFSKFELTGIGLIEQGEYIPGLVITEGTVIEPIVSSRVVVPFGSSGMSDVHTIVRPVGVRDPISLTFSATGAVNSLSNLPVARGDVIMGDGAVIRTDPLGEVIFNGETVSIFGSVFAPGGRIAISGAQEFPLTTPGQVALPTVFIGSQARLSAAGVALLMPDVYGRRRGEVLSGGAIEVEGNIVAEAGAILDVSGTVDMLDLSPAELNLTSTAAVPLNSGINAPLYSLATIPTQVESNGGSIVLEGSELLVSDATLVGRAGGASSLGGFLSVSSGRFVAENEASTTADINLIVQKSGSYLGKLSRGIGEPVYAYDGTAIKGMGFFAIDRFEAGGFGSLELGGNIQFKGPISIKADYALMIGGGGVVQTESVVSLKAPYIRIGQEFEEPFRAADRVFLFEQIDVAGVKTEYHPMPAAGVGELVLSASLIDVGNVVLDRISRAEFSAEAGDIRGNGALIMKGDLLLKAGQIYPTTASDFDIFVYDIGAVPGSVTITGSGSRPLPLSAGGNLTIMASGIYQGGTLRAPLGTITLGWDGSGTAPTNPVMGSVMAAPVTNLLTLARDSITSVSAVDPQTGEGLLIPYGMSPDGLSWVDPLGVDVTLSGLPAKNISLAAQNLQMQEGSLVDISGGGDLYAYRWIEGNGGTEDIAGSQNSFAIIPQYGFSYAPYAPYSHASSATLLLGDIGYVNSNLSVGDQIVLNGSSALPAGTYTLLPARYALLPGAVLVTIREGSLAGSLDLPDGSTLVSGYKTNALTSGKGDAGIYSTFELLTYDAVRDRAEYEDYYANSFLTAVAAEREQLAQRLPADAGRLGYIAQTSLRLDGEVSAQAANNGRGSLIDIAANGNIWILDNGASASGSGIVLDASRLASFGAESLLIGGVRDASGSTVEVRTTNLTLDNRGSNFSAPEIILAAKEKLTLAEDSSVVSTGALSGAGADLKLTGDGAVVRVSGDAMASMSRTGFTAANTTELIIGAGVHLRGNGITLDSTYDTNLDSSATLDAAALYLNSGRISILLDNPGALPGDNFGLVLGGVALQTFENARFRSLLSYSSLDIYGTGQIGVSGVGNMNIRAGEIRGFNQGAGGVRISAANIFLDNTQNAISSAGGGMLSGSLEFDARTVQIGTNQLAINNYANVSLNASGGILGTGVGGLSVQGGLMLRTPLLTGAQASIQTITSGGDLTIESTSGSPAVVSGGLGASLRLTGASIRTNSDIVLPSGLLALHATQGDVVVGGNLDVSGTEQAFYDLLQYTSAGEISLSSEAGDVSLLAGSRVSVAAHSRGGDAGLLEISTPAGSATLAGDIFGQGGAGGESGMFSMDAWNLGNFDALNLLLNDGGFLQSRAFRSRADDGTGDVTLGAGVSAFARNFSLYADAAAITIYGKIVASGVTGGEISLVANKNVTLMPGAFLTVRAEKFSNAGKGGKITIEAGTQRNGTPGTGVIELQAGSVIDLSVDEADAGSAASGRFTGTLHLRAPQNANATDIQIAAVDADINGASYIFLEGYRIFDLTLLDGRLGAMTATTADDQPLGGLILSSGIDVGGSISTNGDLFAQSEQAIRDRLLTGRDFDAVAFIGPGAELINRTTAASTAFTLSSIGSTIQVSAEGVLFPSGTPGDTTIRSSRAGILRKADGTETAFAANVALTVPEGSMLLFPAIAETTLKATITYAGGTTGGAIAVNLPSGGAYTSGTTGAAGIITAPATSVVLRTRNTSAVDLAAGTQVLLPAGASGTSRIRSTVGGTITSSTGVTTVLAANTDTIVSAGSILRLNTSGRVTFSQGTSAISLSLVSGSMQTVGAVDITPPTGNITLGSITSTTTNDWNFSEHRFGVNDTPGVLTMRATGNLVFYNALSDGFSPVTASAATGNSTLWLAPLMAANSNPLIPANLQSWSYRLAAGADLSAASFRSLLPASLLGTESGSVLVGKNAGSPGDAGGTAAETKDAIVDGSGRSLFQVIRTGSGDIDIFAARNIRLLNLFASIYTAGTQVSDPTRVFQAGDFVVPVLTPVSNPAQTDLGAIQQPYYAQYSMAGGNILLSAGENIDRKTRNSSGLIDDSSRQLPNNWLYRRSIVGSDGEYGEVVIRSGFTLQVEDLAASTTWWIDFSNFFQGVGALGGGDITMLAGNDVKNMDAVIPTNARAAQGTPTVDGILELGGGDLVVRSGNDINAGVYYVESGTGTLQAGGGITTNATRSPSLGIVEETSLNSPQNDAYFSSSYSDTWLPTTLFIGKASFDVSARGDIVLGPAVNPFLLPQGLNNKFWYKTYFSTYSSESSLSVDSLGGEITLRNSITLKDGSTDVPILQVWYERQQLLSSGSISAAWRQPWLRLVETQISPFALASTFSLLPPEVKLTAFSGDVNLVGDMTLFPAATGQLEIASAGAINALQPTGRSSANALAGGQSVLAWASATVNLSDADPAAIPSMISPISSVSRTTVTSILSGLQSLFEETGAYTGKFASAQLKQSLHSAGLLHSTDEEPLRLYATGGNIDGLTLYSAKQSYIFASQDIRNIAFYLQNVEEEDSSIVAAGRDILAYSADSPLRTAATATGNALVLEIGAAEPARLGDIQIGGPGSLQILAGRNLDLGTGAESGGLGIGIASIGNARNPYLPFLGADLYIGAGIEAATGLDRSELDIDGFLDEYLDQYRDELPDGTVAGDANKLDASSGSQLALRILPYVLRDVGRSSMDTGSYDVGFAAINTLFGESILGGDINTRARSILTKSGGSINIYAPGGSLAVAETLLDANSQPGIITEYGGDIFVLTEGDVNIGKGRIFTLRGGDIVIWSSTGDIAAGAAPKTVASAPPTRVLIDPQSAAIETDLSGLFTGGGIGVLSTVEGVPEGDVDLIAPNGTVDAGDAGIRATGNLNIAAVQVLNADNISVGGTSTGVPSSPSVAAPNISALSAASSTTGATTSAAESVANQAAGNERDMADTPSIISAEVLGYGGGEEEQG